MISKIIPFLSRHIPNALAIKGIQKVNPKIGSFITSALGAGYTTDAVLDYIREKFESTSSKSIRASEGRIGTGTLRPDEERAINKQKRSQQVQTAAAGLLGLGSGLASLGGSEVEEEQQQQAPSSIIDNAPQHAQMRSGVPGAFDIQRAQQDDASLAEQERMEAEANKTDQESKYLQKQFLNRSKFEQSKELEDRRFLNKGALEEKRAELRSQAEEKKEARRQALEEQKAMLSNPATVLEKFPELKLYLEQQLGNGQQPEVVSWIAKNHSKFKDDVKFIERSTKQPMEMTIQQIYGQSLQQPMQESQQQPQQRNGVANQTLMSGLQRIQEMVARL